MLHKTLWSLCLLLTFPRLAVCWPKLCFSFILSKCHPEAKKSQSSWIKASSLPLYWVCGLFKGFLVFQKDPCVVFSLICGAWHPMLDEKQLPRISLYTQLTSLLRIIRRKEQQLSVCVAVGCHTSKSFCIDSLLMDLSKQGLNSDST